MTESDDFLYALQDEGDRFDRFRDVEWSELSPTQFAAMKERVFRTMRASGRQRAVAREVKSLDAESRRLAKESKDDE